jgi:hypothetical protein
MDLWLRTDETEEAISGLEMLAEICPTLTADSYRWKWAILAVHNSLQGFMVLALRHGNNLAVLRPNIAQKWLEARREGGKYPDERMDPFPNLYGKIKSDLMLCYVNGKKFAATSDHDRAVEDLNNLRNDFIHFVPKGWSIELAGLPDICLTCLEVVEFLGWESGNVFFYDENQEERAQKALKFAKELLHEIKQKYEAAATEAN